jgi:hypothetical protein
MLLFYTLRNFSSFTLNAFIATKGNVVAGIAASSSVNSGLLAMTNLGVFLLPRPTPFALLYLLATGSWVLAPL